MEQSKDFEWLVKAIKNEFPNFEVVPKSSSWLMKGLYTFSLMRFWNPHFMEVYITALFGKVYMPERFIGTQIGYEVLRHEYVHLRDAARFPVLFELSYLFLPLPVIFTLRAYWEYRGYCESLLAEYERLGYVRASSLDFIVKQFTGSSYLWMFPFPKLLRRAFSNFLEVRRIAIKY